MRLAIPAALLTGLMATPSLAADLNVSLTIPTLKVAEYHRPYVAVWVETPDQNAVKTLAVWYDTKLAKREGETWLKDMRQWWRRAGREMKMPVDGVTGATRAPGKHQLVFKGGASPLGALPPGQYNLVVEAAREVGGRELLRAPFQWPPAKAATASTNGASELTSITVSTKP